MKLKDNIGLLGFTKTELTVLFFLIVLFFIGFLARVLNTDKLQFKNYNYNKSDSLFLALQNNQESYVTNSDYKVAYQKKDLEVEKRVLKNFDNSLPVEKSIDINAASMDDLIKLPGIGEKTAEKIIALRNEKGAFTSIEELKEVKGIQNKKFEKIRKYIFIE